jgi:hypothetical protein
MTKIERAWNADERRQAFGPSYGFWRAIWWQFAGYHISVVLHRLRGVDVDDDDAQYL